MSEKELTKKEILDGLYEADNLLPYNPREASDSLWKLIKKLNKEVYKNE